MSFFQSSWYFCKKKKTQGALTPEDYRNTPINFAVSVRPYVTTKEPRIGFYEM
jgi:hypothetical protein